ncbi:acyl-homoserine-lactone synthase [Ancylobacter sp. WKF20]|uniref:acyl-homoserine-lactone synthase n=1 Tax=Ancylobacter sp. WKF20 TaxID=3039801 RepID=UPI0024344A91|nr:acyl-homoserine-lactone synthase [Ancylobacter sp. WKF20]WGD29870.1 acyl-homoserine-lactone synthase [Ancylobacter sp. WKF20]
MENDDPGSFQAFSRFRHFYFVEQLGWPLQTDDGYERDEFDGGEAVYCVLFEENEVIGGFRALPTERPYLGLTVFPQLATLASYPRRPDAWEVTRLGGTRHQALTYGLMFHFARQQRARALVAVVDTAHERLLRRLGIRTRRYGPPQQIGVTIHGRSIEAVAGEIPIGDQDPDVLDRFLICNHTVDIADATLVLRSASIPA